MNDAEIINNFDTPLVFGRIYSIWDTKRRMFRYVGQTTDPCDYTPHGTVMRRLWKRDAEFRYVYVIEREWNPKTQKNLDIAEIRFVSRRRTFNDDNRLGLNFTAGGSLAAMLSRLSRGKMSRASKTVSQVQALRDLRSINSTRWHKLFREEHRKATIAAMARPSVREKHLAGAMKRRKIRIPKITLTAEERSAKCKKSANQPSALRKYSAAAKMQWRLSRGKMLRAIRHSRKKISAGTRSAFDLNGRAGYRVATPAERYEGLRLYGLLNYHKKCGHQNIAADLKRQIDELKESRRIKNAA